MQPQKITFWSTRTTAARTVVIENARRVQTLMRVHGSGQFHSDPDYDDPQLVDLDALAAEEKESAQVGVA
jgi:hypothetical protein